MGNQNAECSGPASIQAFLGGAIAGVIAGILVTPKSGTETRRRIKDYADKTEEKLIEKAEETRVGLDETIERGKQFVVEKKADLEAAIKAGRGAMKETMEQCCR